MTPKQLATLKMEISIVEQALENAKELVRMHE